jgi:hypothetical protein
MAHKMSAEYRLRLSEGLGLGLESLFTPFCKTIPLSLQTDNGVLLSIFSTHRKSQLASSLRELSSNHNIRKLPACELAFSMSGKDA